jgi:hypothetical protein
MSKEISNFVQPEKPTGRFVQHYLNNTPFIRFSSDESENHHNISMSLIEEYNSALHPFSIINHPSGRGFYKLLKDGTIQLYGDKYQEEVHPNQKHLDKLRIYLPEGIKLEITKD